MRRVLLVVVVLAMAIFFTGCSESDGAKYQKAEQYLADGRYAEAAEIFSGLGEYEDATAHLMYCRAEEAKASKDWSTAKDLFDSLRRMDYADADKAWDYTAALEHEDKGEYRKAKEAFESLNGYKDAAEQAAQVTERAYRKAEEAAGSKDWNTAKAILDELVSMGYRDADQYLEYIGAMELEDGGEYRKAAEAFAGLDGYRDAAEQAVQVPERAYQKAAEFRAGGDDLSAYLIYRQIPDYQDVKDLLSGDAGIKAAAEAYQEQLKQYSPGKRLTFGQYDGSPLEWLVLDVQDEKALVLCTRAVTKMLFDPSDIHYLWSECAVRAWLNGDFMAAAFSGEEQGAIRLSLLDNGRYDVGYMDAFTIGFPDTYDRVFLLSYHEAKQYFEVYEGIEGIGGITRSARNDRSILGFSYAGINPLANPPSWKEESVTPSMWLDLSQLVRLTVGRAEP